MIGPLRILLLIAFAVWFWAYRRASPLFGAGLVGALTAIFVGSQSLLSPPLNALVQAAAIAAAVMLVLVRQASTDFFTVFARTDATVKTQLLKLEDDFRAGNVDGAEYLRQFDVRIDDLRRLQPPSEEWAEIKAERLSILAQWRATFASSTPVDEQAYGRLGAREDQLRRRIEGLRPGRPIGTGQE